MNYVVDDVNEMGLNGIPRPYLNLNLYKPSILLM